MTAKEARAIQSNTKNLNFIYSLVKDQAERGDDSMSHVKVNPSFTPAGVIDTLKYKGFTVDLDDKWTTISWEES